MTNPTPRPALRKAEDADVHPAAPRPTRSPRSRTTSRSDAPSAEAAPAAVTAVPTPDEKPVAKKAPAKPRSAGPAVSSKRRARKFSGSTSDHMRVADAPETPEPVAVAATPKKSATRSVKAAIVEPTTNETATAEPTPPATKVKPTVDAALLKGKSVELEVHVPKNLRKAARAEAKKRGLDIDTVVIDLLHAWLTDQR
jgi:hypothetical protein